MKLSRVEAGECEGGEPEAETVEPPLAATSSRPGAERGRRSRRSISHSKRRHSCFIDCICNGRELPASGLHNGVWGAFAVPTDELMRGEIPKWRASIKTPAELDGEFFGTLKGTEDGADDDSDGDKGVFPSAIRILDENDIKKLAKKSGIELSDHLELPVMEAWNSFYRIETIDEGVNVLPGEQELEFIETEMTLDIGATVHAADRDDLPAHIMMESAGSKAGQKLGCAGGKLVANEGECKILLVAPGGISCELAMIVQIAKITRPLISVIQMTRHGDISMLCTRGEALVLDEQNQTLGVFKKKGGLYVANMRVRNPKFNGPFGRPA